jgi:hypothetical protein
MSNQLRAMALVNTMVTMTVTFGGFVVVMMLIMSILERPRRTYCPRCKKKTLAILVRDVQTKSVGDIYCHGCGHHKATVFLIGLQRASKWMPIKPPKEEKS